MDFEMDVDTYFLVVVVIIIIGCLWSRRDPFRLFLLVVASLPFEGALVLEVGFTIRLAYIFLALTMLALLIRRSWALPRTPLDIPLWIYFAIAAISLVQPIIHSPPVIELAETMSFRASSFRGLIQLALLAGMMICFYMTVFFASDRKQFEKLMKLFILTGIFASLYGIYQVVATTLGLPLEDINNSIRTGGQLVYGALAGWGPPTGGIGFWRAHSVFQEPSNLAAYLIAVFPLVIVLLLSKNQSSVFSRRNLYIFAIIILLGIAVTWSRLIFVALIPALILMLFHKKTPTQYFFSVLKILLPVILAVIVIYQIFAIFIPVITLDNLFSAWISTGGFSFQDIRFEFWKIVIDVWKEHPILGVGLGAFGYYGAEVLGMNILMSAHSWVLGTLAELGIVGLSAWTFLFASYFWIMKKAIVNNKHGWTSPYLIGFLVGFFGTLLASLTFGDRLSQYAWFYMGLSMAAVSISPVEVDK